MKYKVFVFGITDYLQAAGSHGQREKFNAFAAELQNAPLLCSIFFISDLSRKHSDEFHHVSHVLLTTYYLLLATWHLLLSTLYMQWTKQRCPIYGWSNDFKAHLIAWKVTILYLLLTYHLLLATCHLLLGTHKLLLTTY